MNLSLYSTEEPINPQLVEPGVAYFLGEMLKQAHIAKAKYYATVYNIAGFAAFFLIVGFICVYRYRGKPTKEEMQQREILKQQYILEVIKKQQIDMLKDQQQLLTGLPVWDRY